MNFKDIKFPSRIFITGIDTDAGKSYATGWIARGKHMFANLLAFLDVILYNGFCKINHTADLWDCCFFNR